MAEARYRQEQCQRIGSRLLAYTVMLVALWLWSSPAVLALPQDLTQHSNKGDSTLVKTQSAPWFQASLGYVFQHLTNQDGLPQNSVNAIVQDARGFWWFATQDGLCRYDGYTMKVFRPEKGNPRALSGGFIFHLFLDKRGNLWVCTSGAGLNRYNYTTGDFTVYRHDPKNPKTLPGDKLSLLLRMIRDTYGSLLKVLDCADFIPSVTTSQRFVIIRTIRRA